MAAPKLAANSIHLVIIIAILISIIAPYNTMADYVLYTGEVLLAGQNLTNGQHQLAMQPDCNLVLYKGGSPAWRAKTSSSGDSANCYLALKHTGEAVVRSDVHYTLWSTGGKSKKGKYALVLNKKGRIGVYGPRRWTTNNEKAAAGDDGQWSTSKSAAVTTPFVLYSGQRLNAPMKLSYRNYELGLTSHCNMVIKETTSNKVLWQSSTKANKSCYLGLESDGELTLKNGGQRLWSSNKRGESGSYVAVLRFDARLAVYGPLMWSNNNKAPAPAGTDHSVDDGRFLAS